MLLSCPKQEGLFEYVTIPGEMSMIKRLSTRAHLAMCGTCKSQSVAIQAKWNGLFQPEPELTSSLIKVYSRLKNDETLILKGWKLNELPHRRTLRSRLFKEGWFFRGAVSMSLASLVFAVVFMQVRAKDAADAPGEAFAHAQSGRGVPWAQIRVEDKNRVQVRYVRPELLQSMEFETVSTR